MHFFTNNNWLSPLLLFITFIILILSYTCTIPLFIIYCIVIVAFYNIIFISKDNITLSGLLNIGLLLYIPLYLNNTTAMTSVLNHRGTLLYLFLITVFIMTLFNFFALATYLKRPKHNPLMFQNLLIIFLIYITLIFVTINCFAILYFHLCAVSNEGITSETFVSSQIDALYFSTTTFFTIGLGDIKPTTYATITKTLVIIEAIVSHIITVILWPVAIIIIFNKLES